MEAEKTFPTLFLYNNLINSFSVMCIEERGTTPSKSYQKQQ